jgi:ABC-type polar amino acid transport system ATPase subunit
MTEYNYHHRLRLQNFTAFHDVNIEFVPGINVFVGENGTGKTHLMKALYAFQLATRQQGLEEIDNSQQESPKLRRLLSELFQTPNVQDLVRQGGARATAQVQGQYGSGQYTYAIHRSSTRPSNLPPQVTFVTGSIVRPERPVFIPAIDMMGHTQGFLAASREVVLDFDLTCSDIVTLMTLRNNTLETTDYEDSDLAALLGGNIEQDPDGRFYLVTKLGRQPMPMVAEGLRKIATFVQLERNGWLAPGSTLFWDEPEVNLNPVLMDELIGEILTLARSGVQVFLATHSYVILKELDLQATLEDNVRFFSLKGDKTGTQVMATDTFTALKPNPILQQYGSLYDRDISRATGRKPRSEKVR